jgi:hypothetical protein
MVVCKRKNHCQYCGSQIPMITLYFLILGIKPLRKIYAEKKKMPQEAI